MTPTPAPDSRAVLLATVTERQWQAQVETWAKRAGWRVYHTWRSIHSTPGFPDLCLVKPPRVVFMELKSQKGLLSKAQMEWLVALGECSGVESYMYRPADEIEVKRVLQ